MLIYIISHPLVRVKLAVVSKQKVGGAVAPEVLHSLGGWLVGHLHLQKINEKLLDMICQSLMQLFNFLLLLSDTMKQARPCVSPSQNMTSVF